MELRVSISKSYLRDEDVRCQRREEKQPRQKKSWMIRDELKEALLSKPTDEKRTVKQINFGFIWIFQHGPSSPPCGQAGCGCRSRVCPLLLLPPLLFLVGDHHPLCSDGAGPLQRNLWNGIPGGANGGVMETRDQFKLYRWDNRNKILHATEYFQAFFCEWVRGLSGLRPSLNFYKASTLRQQDRVMPTGSAPSNHVSVHLKCRTCFIMWFVETCINAPHVSVNIS